MSEAGHKKVTVPMLEVTGLKRTFDVSAPWLNRVLEGRPRSIVRAVDGVNFSINKGETFSLVGESGCGKSTVARLIVGLYEPSAGSVNFEGYEVGPLTERKKHRDIQARMQMIFQDRSEEHTSELQSLMRTSYAVFCLTKTPKSLSKK